MTAGAGRGAVEGDGATLRGSVLEPHGLAALRKLAAEATAKGLLDAQTARHR